MSKQNSQLLKKEKQAKKDMRALNRALELHLIINGSEKQPGYNRVLEKLNSERAKHGLPAVTRPVVVRGR